MGELHRRDRRWAQGNLQHLRVIGARGLHPVSRLHFASGLQSYLSAPLWLGLVALFASGAVRPGALAGLTVLLVAAALLVPKLAGLAFWHARLGPRHDRARRLLRRAALGELALSSALAPLMMWRQSLAVAAVLAGQDCGWKRAGPRRRPLLPGGVGEAMAGVGLLTLAGLGAAGGGALAVVIVLPVAGPLLAAPLLTRWFDAEPAPALPVEARAMALGKA